MMTSNSVDLVHDFGVSVFTDGVAIRWAVEKNLTYLLRSVYRSISMDKYPNDIFPDAVTVVNKVNEEANNHEAVYKAEDYVISVTAPMKDTQSTVIDIWAHDEARARELMAIFKNRVPERKPVLDNDQVIDLKFWYDTPRGPGSVTRTIEIPRWQDIVGNYPNAIGAKLSHMMNDFQPSHGGQLILWHGRPGTGKTYAIRAMLGAWRKWCEACYIIDPEKFFGSDSQYLINVLLESPSVLPDFDFMGDDEPKQDRWRLLIFEDTGELMADNAGERTGQGLSRLLNTVDGLIGQGLKIMLLVTTNEELENLHPAVSRSGRASEVIQFEMLSAAESVAWGKEHGIDVEKKPHVVSDLYALLEGFRKSDEGGKVKQSIGFLRTS